MLEIQSAGGKGVIVGVVVEIGRPHHVTRASRDIAGLDIIRRAGLILPGRILLHDQSQFTLGFTIAQCIRAGVGRAGRVGAIGR
ncbi:MAG: hypothetical protein P8Y53_24020 [Pseudolabrys sp.]